MIIYSWIQIGTEWIYGPVRLEDTICSPFKTRGLFHLRIAVTFFIQLRNNIYFFTQDSFFGLRIYLFMSFVFLFFYFICFLRPLVCFIFFPILYFRL